MRPAAATAEAAQCQGVVNRDKAVAAIDNKFLNNFPPADAAMKFWNIVFFA